MAELSKSDSLGDLIRKRRVKKELSLRSLAAQLEITPSYLSDIENDRRVPAEDVVRQIARLLEIDFNDLMARAGKFGRDAERYLRRQPAAGQLFRRISEANLDEDRLGQLLKQVEEMEKDANR
jgi:transcriptional regulator with XRE-family HTH domain